MSLVVYSCIISEDSNNGGFMDRTEIFGKIAGHIKEQMGAKLPELTPETVIADLGMDSLDTNDDVGKAVTLGDLVDLVQKSLDSDDAQGTGVPA